VRRALGIVFLAASGASLAISAACGEDTGLVRPRLEGGAGDPTGIEAGTSCNVTFPGTYESPTFETNAAQELLLRKDFDAFLAPMRGVESQLDAGAATPVTKAQLDVLYTADNPSVKTATTSYYQAKVEAWLASYETALTDGAYVPDAPSAAEKGGTLGGWVFDPTGLDLHQAIEKGSYPAAFYNQAVALIAAGSLTVGSIDRLVALFGAHPSFPNDPNASQNKDVNAAALAAHRDSKDAANPGPYQRIRSALIKARAAVAAGDPCTAERDATLKIFLSEWEKSNYATVIFDFNDIIAKLSAAAVSDYAPILHSYGEAVGLISGFKSIAQGRRIITDAQIDGLLEKVFAADGNPVAAYTLKTNAVQAAAQLQQAISDIKGIYAFSDADVEAFKKDN
jgi:hypothetical protein